MSKFAHRRERLRSLLAQKSLGPLLVTDPLNVTYLTGFTGDSSYLLVAGQRELLITDGRYKQQLSEECPGLELAIREPGIQLPDFTVQMAASLAPSSLAIEADDVTVSFYEKLHSALKTSQLAHTSGLVESLREIKDADEIAEIREAIEIAEEAFSKIRA